MATSLAVVFISFLAFNQVLGEPIIEELEKELSQASKWLEHEAAVAKTGVTGALGDVRTVHHHVVDRVKRINGLYDRALTIAQEAPKECQGDVRNSLMVLKKGGVGSFLTCSKLIEAGQDIISIGWTSAGIVFDVLDIGRDFTMGFSGCLSSFWPWKIIGCWVDRVWTTFDDVKKILSDITHYTSNIKELAVNATTLIEECWHGSSKSENNNVLRVMRPLHECANEPIPHHLYEL